MVGPRLRELAGDDGHGVPLVTLDDGAGFFGFGAGDGRLPDDDVECFVRALEEVYGVRVERRADGVIVLRKGG